ncbi:MAG TPA: flagellar hook-basal body complex protein, partial [Egibacteraceae bacterium]|nr:flagellar hook-basal body complex protein [Egibacteraceae bacterium]
RGFDFATDGTITGRFSNGQTKLLGAVAIATFNNPGGLQKYGENLYSATLNSGQALVGLPGDGDAGVIAPGSLEMSNVDLAQEFTNLIIAQRGFQANARSISSSDEMLADIVNLKR